MTLGIRGWAAGVACVAARRSCDRCRVSLLESAATAQPRAAAHVRNFTLSI